jgi:hypothetical protein
MKTVFYFSVYNSKLCITPGPKGTFSNIYKTSVPSIKGLSYKPLYESI